MVLPILALDKWKQRKVLENGGCLVQLTKPIVFIECLSFNALEGRQSPPNGFEGTSKLPAQNFIFLADFHLNKSLWTS